MSSAAPDTRSTKQSDQSKLQSPGRNASGLFLFRACLKSQRSECGRPRPQQCTMSNRSLFLQCLTHDHVAAPEDGRTPSESCLITICVFREALSRIHAVGNWNVSREGREGGEEVIGFQQSQVIEVCSPVDARHREPQSPCFPSRPSCPSRDSPCFNCLDSAEIECHSIISQGVVSRVR